MKRLTTVLFVFAIAILSTNSFAVEQIEQKAQEAQQTQEVVFKDVTALEDTEASIDCSRFDCPISSRVRVIRYFETTDNCPEISEERIRALAEEIAKELCSRLQDCCKEQGCDEFRCAMAGYRWECVSRNRLCIQVAVDFKCG